MTPEIVKKNMTPEIVRLRIRAERIGTVREVKQLLSDFENAYNSIYAFDFLVETLSIDRKRKLRQWEEKSHFWRKYLKEYAMRKNYSYDELELGWERYLYKWERYLYKTDEGSTNLLELCEKIDIEKIVLPAERLSISKINIQSLGFWEFLGSLSPLEQIREYLKDRHERQKDRKYRNRIEEKLGDLSIMEKENNIISQRIEILREFGYSEVEIRQLVMAMIVEPLNKLGKHQDNGQIEGVEQ